MSTTPQVWIGCLASYNAGTLHGEWVDATDAGELREQQTRILGESPAPGAEEAFIADYDGFGGLASSLGEYPNYDDVAQTAQLIEEHGRAYIAYAEYVGPDYATADDFEESYAGEWDSEEAFAENLADEVGAVPDDLSWPLTCIDWERAARDLFLSGYYSVRDDAGTLYVFQSI